MIEKILLIGPCPPPDGGTTIPFRIFCEFAKANYGTKYSFSIVDSTTGDKSSTSIMAPLMLARVVQLIGRIVVRSLRADRVVIFGSQRFVTMIGGLVIILIRPFGKRTYLRINGGGYDLFYESSSSIMKIFIRRILSKADAIVVQTDLVRTAMADVWHDKVYAVSNYRAIATYDPSARLFAPSKVRFIYTGIVRQLKGCDELLNAFVELNRILAQNGHSIETQLDLFGRYFNSANEPLNIAQFRDKKNIVFHGPIPNEDLQQKYEESDVFVFPSYWPTEGHPGSIVEALMFGLPVIASDWRAIPEIIHDGVNGLFCKARDVDSLVQAMYTMSVDIEKRKRISQAARISAKRFDQNVVCAELAALLDLDAGPRQSRPD